MFDEHTEKNSEKSHRKIISVSIICLALVASVWVFQRNSTNLKADDTKNSTNNFSVENNPRPEIVTNTDWQKTLQGAWGQGSTTVLTGSSVQTTVSGEGTLTDQMAKDFMSQYLLAKQGGKTVTVAQATQIAQNTLTLPQYTQGTGVLYTVKDLRVGTAVGSQVKADYLQAITSVIQNGASKNGVTAITVMTKAVQTQSPASLSDLVPIVAHFKNVVDGLRTMTVPPDAVILHLSLLNAYSNLYTNLQGMQVIFTDPVRGFSNYIQYGKHTNDLSTAIQNLNAYFGVK